MEVFRIVGVVFTIIGVIALGGMAFTLYRNLDFLNRSVATQGEVVDMVMRESTDSEGYTSYSTYPIIRYVTTAEQVVEFESGLNDQEITIGELVAVRYIPDEPNSARRDDFFELWWLTFFAGFFMLIFGGMGVTFLWLGLREKHIL